jgi:hypothetical protein
VTVNRYSNALSCGFLRVTGFLPVAIALAAAPACQSRIPRAASTHREFGKSITALEQLTQRTAATSEEGASAAAELNAQSAALEDVAHQLAVIMDGEK